MSRPRKTLGILGGMGPAATANFQRLLVEEFNAVDVFEDSDFPKIIMLSLPLPLDEWDFRGAKDKTRVREHILHGVEWLKAAGASLIAIPCNTVQEFVDGDESVISIVGESLKLCKPGLVGVLCSAQAREAKLYERNGYEIQYYPSQSSVDSIIRSTMYGMRCDIGPMINAEFAKCSSVVLGCTELSLCYTSRVNDKYVVDSTAALAKAVVRLT